MRVRQPDLGASLLVERGEPRPAIEHVRADTTDAAGALVADGWRRSI
jgi:hypothetical protein